MGSLRNPYVLPTKGAMSGTTRYNLNQWCFIANAVGELNIWMEAPYYCSIGTIKKRNCDYTLNLYKEEIMVKFPYEQPPCG